MEELCCANHFHVSNGQWFLSNNIFGSISPYVYGMLSLTLNFTESPLFCQTLCVQVKCFQEIIAIGYSVYRVHGLPWFRSLSWYMLIASNYFFYGESLVDYFGLLLHRTVSYKWFLNDFQLMFQILWKNFMRPLVTYHRFISFCLYLVGFVWFVLSLVKRYYMRQFSLVLIL